VVEAVAVAVVAVLVAIAEAVADAETVDERVCVDVNEAEHNADTVLEGDREDADDELGDEDGVGAGEQARGKNPIRSHCRLDASLEKLALGPSKPALQLKVYKNESALGTDGFEIVFG